MVGSAVVFLRLVTDGRGVGSLRKARGLAAWRSLPAEGLADMSGRVYSESYMTYGLGKHWPRSRGSAMRGGLGRGSLHSP